MAATVQVYSIFVYISILLFFLGSLIAVRSREWECGVYGGVRLDGGRTSTHFGYL